MEREAQPSSAPSDHVVDCGVDHRVELYASDDDFPAGSIARYLATGLRLGEAALIFARPENAHRIIVALSDELPPAVAVWDRFRSIDADDMLARMRSGENLGNN